MMGKVGCVAVAGGAVPGGQGALVPRQAELRALLRPGELCVARRVGGGAGAARARLP